VSIFIELVVSAMVAKAITAEVILVAITIAKVISATTAMAKVDIKQAYFMFKRVGHLITYLRILHHC
jgi:hypothetical protein